MKSKAQELVNILNENMPNKEKVVLFLNLVKENSTNPVFSEALAIIETPSIINIRGVENRKKNINESFERMKILSGLL